MTPRLLKFTPMAITKRTLPPFWRRRKPPSRYDIAKLRPASLPKSERFETPKDARDESNRREAVLRSSSAKGTWQIAQQLHDCRAGYYHCENPICPLCARTFRRWLIGELIQLTESGRPNRILTILLQEASQHRINDLD